MNAAGARALDAWILGHRDGTPWGQVMVWPVPGGHELRHVTDAGVEAPALMDLGPRALREWADTTEGGAFRPLKSAPTLRRGWRCVVTSHEELELALNGLYPGALGDWWALRTGTAVATSFPEFMGRQTGIYRQARGLSGADAQAVARACCAPACCLKHRLWEASPSPADASRPHEPSDGFQGIPCWEPCALAMDMARAAARLSAEPSATLQIPPGDIPVLLAALGAAAALPPTGDVREADLSQPTSPRRMRLLLERLRPEWTPAPVPPET